MEEGASLQFCCGGCRAVHETIHGCGLEEFYRLRSREPAEGAPARTTDRRYDEFDDERFLEEWTAPSGEGVRTAELYLEGVHCAACVWLVERLPRVLPGVVEARLDFRRALVRVVWSESDVRLSRIARALDRLGYAPHPPRDREARAARLREDRRYLVRIGVAGAVAGNVMLLSFALYGGMFSGMEEEYEALFRWVSMGLGWISLAWPGRVFFRGAWAALRTGAAHLDLPIALGLATGGIAGTVHTVTGEGEIYFDSVTVLVFLLLVGRWIQHRQQRWAADSIEILFSLTPRTARRLETAGRREVPIDVVEVGDRLEVLPGESVPCDGVVTSGESSLDISLLTGESRPAEVRVGDRICAGAVNLSSVLQARVEATGRQTRVGRLMRLVEEYTRRKAPIVQLADRMAAAFVVIVVLLASATFALWWRSGVSTAVDSAATVLIVSCPCALGLATPLAVAVTIGRAASRGILVKGGDVMERLARPGLMILDKTGTITEGRLSLVEWTGDPSVRRLVSALESRSSHPVAVALRLERGPDEAADTQNVEQTTGRGVRGSVDGHEVVLGTLDFVREAMPTGIEPPGELMAAYSSAADVGRTPVAVAVDGKLAAVAALGDEVRSDAAGAIDALCSTGWSVEILSGDDPRVVAAVAARVGVPREAARGGASPEAKLARVEEAREQGEVVMVGDGVNDAAALSAASVGIAVHGGAEASLAAADVYSARPGLAATADLVRAAGRALRGIRRALVVSLIYNGVAVALAAGGLINPLIAAILMPISSFTVVAMAFTTRTFPRAR